MSDKLVIVESPAKAKTLKRILGNNFIIKASMGHVRDLPEDELGIQIDQEFKPVYRVISERRSLIKEIKAQANNASAIYLATDPDREGEAISWHLVEAANLIKDNIPIRRVTFHEITKQAVEEAFENPRSIDMKMVDAQQARRILDRLVGYKLSPLLWKKIQKGLSAGRVQSAALRIIVEREREILSFVPIEYWTIQAELTKQQNRNSVFRASLIGDINGKKLPISDKTSCDRILSELYKSEYSVISVNKKQVSRQPAPPFITSTLQQEAWRKLHFTAKKTMFVAQQLYEGLPIGEEGDTGLITYMRTDSTHMAAQAIEETRNYIVSKFGDKFLPAQPRTFGKKVKLAQEAHEAIRPTKIFREPALIQQYLNREQFKLYELIWTRAVASQMAAALYNTVTVEIGAVYGNSGTGYLFQTNASTLTFPGFMSLYIEGKDDENDEYEGKPATLPDLKEGESVKLVELYPEQNFTQPPPRYTEATLIKALEQKGIGRPSTYAPIISTISDRNYVYKENGKLRPEDIGMVVNDLLVSNFSDILDLNFTAKMEDELDEIAKGKRKWNSVIKSFYTPFNRDLEKAQQNLSKIVIPSDESCPECGRPMVVKTSRYGKFLACSGYPKCKGKKAIAAKTEARADSQTSEIAELPQEVLSQPCPVCGKPMILKTGRYGKFLTCSEYPQCKGKRTIKNDDGTGEASADRTAGETKTSKQKCPECGEPMVIKMGKYGKFLACSRYPECKTTRRLYKFGKYRRAKK
ncbi:MAG: type I DNA topoisomerase [Dehalococcoidia bacterium]|nr:type I DNA topoisomerase [Dehalococcoidia bacterium]MDD5493097.1 type I DNA topoisomerase [Dehalococcoidia bacterium]